MGRPKSTEYASYFEKYIALVPEDDILPVFEKQLGEIAGFLREVSEQEGKERHPPYTWSVKEVIGHLSDTERIFGYRALRFARGDQTPLPSFDENEYARIAGFDRTPLKDLAAEFEAVRRSHVQLFRNLPAEAWSRSGAASDNVMSVLAVAYIMAGHARHHFGILRKRLRR